MSNITIEGARTTVEDWLNIPSIHSGILSVYNGEPFNYDISSPGYEIGRQIAILAKSAGLKTRGTILRKKPNSQRMGIVKTKLPILNDILYRQIGFSAAQLKVF